MVTRKANLPLKRSTRWCHQLGTTLLPTYSNVSLCYSEQQIFLNEDLGFTALYVDLYFFIILAPSQCAMRWKKLKVTGSGASLHRKALCSDPRAHLTQVWIQMQVHIMSPLNLMDMGGESALHAKWGWIRAMMFITGPWWTTDVKKLTLYVYFQSCFYNTIYCFLYKEGTYHILVCLSKESFSKDWDNKDIDEEGDEEGDAGLNEEILVGLTDLLLIGPIYLSRLERKMKECYNLQEKLI